MIWVKISMEIDIGIGGYFILICDEWLYILD